MIRSKFIQDIPGDSGSKGLNGNIGWTSIDPYPMPIRQLGSPCFDGAQDNIGKFFNGHPFAFTLGTNTYLQHFRDLF